MGVYGRKSDEEELVNVVGDTLVEILGDVKSEGFTFIHVM